MRILVYVWAVVLVACHLSPTYAGETKRKKLVLVVPEKVRHIHHHHVKKVYVKSKPHYDSYEEGLPRDDSFGSFEVDEDDVGAIKYKPHGHHKRHSSSSRHPVEHKEESKKIVVHSEEIPGTSTWNDDKSTEVRSRHREESYGDYNPTSTSIISKLTNQNSSPDGDSEEQKNTVFLDSDASAQIDSHNKKVKTVYHHHHHHDHRSHHGHHDHHDHHSHEHTERPNPPSNHKSLNHGIKPSNPKPTFIENLVPPPVNQQSYTQVTVGSSGFSHSQLAGPPPPAPPRPPIQRPHNNPPPPPPPSRPHPHHPPSPPQHNPHHHQSVKTVRSPPPQKSIDRPPPQNVPNRNAPPVNQGFKPPSVQKQSQRLWRRR